MMADKVTVYKLPRWMKVPLPKGVNYSRVKQLIQDQKLNTICSSGNCPNKGECWKAGTASFMIMDGGAKFWAYTVRKIRQLNPGTSMEVLIPDFDGEAKHLQVVIDAKPEVISHNLETVRRLTPSVRSNAYYDRSLEVIRMIAGSGLVAKSGSIFNLHLTYTGWWNLWIPKPLNFTGMPG